MHILIATDGDTHSTTAVRSGALWVHAFPGSEATLLTVVRSHADRDGARRQLLEATAQMTHNGDRPTVRATVRVGQPATEIIREAEAGRYDLLIVGQKGHYPLIERLIGPTVQHILDHPPCPVLIAHGEPRRPARLLVCDSGRTPSLLDRMGPGLTPLLAHADAVTVLHVMSHITAFPGVPGWELRADAEELIDRDTPEGRVLARDARILAGVQVTPQVLVRHGLVVDEISAEAQTGDYDLVIVGAHRNSGWGRFLYNDLMREIANVLDRPLLIV